MTISRPKVKQSRQTGQTPISVLSASSFFATLDLRLLSALFAALVFHGTLSIFGSYRNTYDAYVHIFFADHWRRSWFDHWDPRWYTGFTLTSYPPLSQQSVAAVSFLTGDLRLAFALVQTAAMIVMTLGMYRFAQLWVSKEAAGWAALWLVFSSAMAETIHVFGQLPTTYSLALLLNALPFTYAWIVRGKPADLAKCLALTAATTGAHHVTTLFGSVFITAPVVGLALLARWRTPLLDEPQQHVPYLTWHNWRALFMPRFRRVLGPLVRCGVFGVGTISLLLLVVFPYWVWSRADPITQVPIPHASRDNFLVNLNAGLVFWVIPYGMLLFAFPYIFYKGFTTKAWPLICSIALLALLGTGGTTPIPKLLLGGSFNILTLDRFTLWASILMLPLAGEFFVSLWRGHLARWLMEQFGLRVQQVAVGGFVLGVLGAAIFTANLTQFRRFQPAPIDMQPIVNFLEKDEHWRWRYLTLGFGDQMAWLSAQTTATQVDGDYHSARRLPELTTAPVERLENAKYSGIPGIGSLQQFLNVPDKYNLKYVFSNDQFYDPLLFFYGWHKLQLLENGIAVWERADIPILPDALPRREIPLYQRLMFGILPPLALLLSGLTVTAPYWEGTFLLLGEVVGLRASFERLYARLARPLRRLGQAIDRRWWRAAQVPSTLKEAEPRWQRALRLALHRLRRRLRPPSATARQVRVAALVFCLVCVLAVSGAQLLRFFRGPTYQVTQYYDDLDFRRFAQAYARLNPATRPDFTQYMLNLSVQGGLVASYSKLDDLHMQVLQADESQVKMQVEARYLTALSFYTDTQVLLLTHRPYAGWYIEPTPVDLQTPPDEFVRRPTVAWLAQGRRRATSETTDLADALDRPELQILSARLVLRAGGRYSVVGEVMNTDADPADVTVSAYIYDQNNAMLSWFNAGAGMMHKLLPLEITPFRVDFEGVAGLALQDVAQPLPFSPGAIWDYHLPVGKQVGRFAVAAKAVVAQQDLDQDVGVQNLVVTDQANGWLVQGVLINAGLQEAVIPHLLFTLYDATGRVAWVDQAYVPVAVRPQRTQPFAYSLMPASQLTPVNVAGADDTNALVKLPGMAGARPDFIALPPASGYRYLRVSVNYFSGGGH